ncbi:MAG TPA: thermonuclease family protein [Vicinamibacterales bacterium]|nr:thermonuclease family protein [Vicinamibacterales bacterium]
MQILLLALAGMMAPFQLVQPGAPTDPVLVTQVSSGDAITVASFGRVRLLGIAAPRIGRGFDNAAPFAFDARDRLSGLVLHRWVRLEFERRADGTWITGAASVLLEDGTFVNALLVREGLARVSGRTSARRAELLRAQEEARAARRGLWDQEQKIRRDQEEIGRKRCETP